MASPSPPVDAGGLGPGADPLLQRGGLDGGLVSARAEQGAQADLVQDSLAGEGFGEHTDQNPEHGGPAVEQFSPLQLLGVDLGGGSRFVPGQGRSLAAGGAGTGGIARRHGLGTTPLKCNVSFCSLDPWLGAVLRILLVSGLAGRPGVLVRSLGPPGYGR